MARFWSREERAFFSRLALRLADAGASVHVFARAASSLWRIEGALDRITIWRGDLNDRESIRDCLLASRPDVVFHLAGNPAARRLDAGLENVEGSVDTLRGTIHLIDELRRADIPIRYLVRSGGPSRVAFG